MSSFYLYFKALHIIGFVSWFAGMFYLVRIFVYYSEVDQKPSHIQEDWRAQFILMAWRVYKIIMNPAMMITWIFGLSMILTNTALFGQAWLQVKLVLLVVLTAYHLYCKQIIKRQEKGELVFDSFQFRLLNEVPTLFLVAIVLLAVLRDLLSFLYLFLGILAFGFMLFKATKAYKRHRENDKK